MHSLGYGLKQGFKSLFRNRLFTLASIGTIIASLFIFGIFYCILANFQSMFTEVETSVGVTVFFDEGTTEERILEIKSQLEQQDTVDKVEYTSAEQAWEDYKNRVFPQGDDDILTNLDQDNPLANSASLTVYLTDTAPAKNEKKNTPENLSFTGTAATVYAMTGTALSIYKATDGNWYDKNGIKFTWLTDTKLTNDDGDSFTTSPTFGSTYFTGNSTTVYSLSGTPVTIRENTDGYWYTDSGVKMTWLDGSRLESDGGEAFVTDQPDTNDYSDQEGEGDLVYCEYCGQWYEAGNVFRNHICPARDAALAAEN